MDAGRGEAQQHVAGPRRQRQGLAALDRTDRKAGQVEIALRIHARHLGGLTPDQRAARLAAALGDALDDPGGLVDRQFAGREIIEEHQRLGALAHEIVDAHGDEIDAHRVEAPGVDRDPQLGADAVGGGDQDRIAVARRLQIEEPAEPAETRDHPGPVGRLGRRLDPLDERVPGIDVDTGILVGQGVRTVGHADMLRIWRTGTARLAQPYALGNWSIIVDHTRCGPLSASRLSAFRPGP